MSRGFPPEKSRMFSCEGGGWGKGQPWRALKELGGRRKDTSVNEDDEQGALRCRVSSNGGERQRVEVDQEGENKQISCD